MQRLAPRDVEYVRRRRGPPALGRTRSAADAMMKKLPSSALQFDNSFDPETLYLHGFQVIKTDEFPVERLRAQLTRISCNSRCHHSLNGIFAVNVSC